MPPASGLPSRSTPSFCNALGELHRGMSFGYLARPGFFDSEVGRTAVTAMAALGIRWVALMVTITQETFASRRVFRDFELTPDDAELERIIAHCHASGLRVMLKPMVECLDSAWRGRITFPDGDQQIQGRQVDYWGDWFASHTLALCHYARLAERTGCEIFSVGCELVGTDLQSARWQQSIAEVRSAYPGPLTYDAQPESILADTPPAWFSDLDIIGCSFYVPGAVKPGATRDEMTAELAPSVQRFARAAEKIGRPLIFAEAGCRSALGAAIKPAGYAASDRYSGEEQAHYLDAFCSLYWDQPWWRGFYWWKWDEQQHRPHYHADPAGDTGFTLAGKPAEKVLERWFRRSDR
jgi:hypothetical protein